MSINWKNLVHIFVSAAALTTVLTVTALAQYGGPTGGGTTGGPTSVYNFHSNYHLGFDKPEAWGLKYFASTSLLSGLPLPPSEEHRTGSITVGFELGWLPQLNAGQRNIGFGGQVPEDLNKAPI